LLVRDEPAAAAAAEPAFLRCGRLAVVAEIAEIMIPKTETSGAKDAGVPAFIDSALDALYPKADQDVSRPASPSSRPSPRIRQAVPRPRTGRTRGLREASPRGRAARDHDQKPFILMTRELALLGYFTSKVGITENMEYVAVPTAFHGCVPLSKMNKPVYWE
jgi:hypothetical protein